MKKALKNCRIVLTSAQHNANGSVNRDQYMDHVNELMTVLNGKVTNIITDLSDEMSIHAQAGRFEKAAVVRDIIENIKSIFKPQRNFATSALKQRSDLEAVNELQKYLNLENPPKVIECFDNSNFQGSNAVASMVQFRDGKPYHKELPAFKIKTVEGIDDFASMREIVKRRYSTH